jgi:hypothetical protein
MERSPKRAFSYDLTRRARRSGEINLAAYAVPGLACCATCAGDLHQAAALHGAAGALNELLGGEWADPEEAAARCRGGRTMRRPTAYSRPA